MILYILYLVVSNNVPRLRASVLWRRYVLPKQGLRKVWVELCGRAGSVVEGGERGLDVEMGVWVSQETTLNGSVDSGTGETDGCRFYEEDGHLWVDM